MAAFIIAISEEDAQVIAHPNMFLFALLYLTDLVGP